MNTPNSKLQRNQELALIIKNTYGKPELRYEYNAACEEFLKAYKALITKFIKKYKSSNLNSIYEDLIIHFQQATIKACNTYDETKGSNITSYLFCALDNASSSFHKEDITKYGNISKNTYIKLSVAYAHIQDKKEPLTVENLMKLAKCNEDTVYGFLSFCKTCSLDDTITDSDNKQISLSDKIKNDTTMEEVAMQLDDKEIFRLALKILPNKYAKVIYLTYFKEKTQKEIAKIVNGNQSTICKQIKKATNFLKILTEENNLACTKLIFKLKEKSKKMSNNNLPYSLENLIEGENISPKQLYTMFNIAKFNLTGDQTYLKITLSEKEPCNLLNLSEKNKMYIADVITGLSNEELSKKYTENHFLCLDNEIKSLTKNENKIK